ncbi:type II secretion system inner membrane protein GspF [Pseudomonas oryzihabitans]|uniref:General secretion pathway protein F n=1 Tax=Pseudomonas oryzihabitans TaxID=47885 RepID=A0A1G5PCV0_9PSED|nr:type II secretion system inner membrane protein GspF [Pseudomonas psychrotolerans]NMY92365.1 type II secretion system inner membrane protein GspF [Pseudomonas psychrotolerans]SCZ47372.1 general secretion pathway protein F [Pseudomonas psychrotolerans]
MPAYRYLALDGDGRRQRDVIQAESERHARQLLRERGLFPREVQASGPMRGARGRGGRLDANSRTDFTRQLATLVGAAIPLAEALQMLERQSRQAALKALLLDLLGQVREGYTLADSLGRHPGTFDPLYLTLVAAGERAGRLGPVLERLADYLERVQRQRHKARTALIYPLALALVSIAVVAGLMTFVVPKLTEQFIHSGLQLPWITRALVAVSDGLLVSGPWLLGLLVLAGVGLQRLLRQVLWRRRWHRQLLRLPRLGELLRTLDSARLTRSLAILVGSGIPVLEGLQVSRATLGNQVLGDALDAAIEQVTAGTGLGRALDRTAVFPPLLVNMVASGEASSTLDAMLERVADAQERDFNQQVDLALALFEPVLILILGGVVLAIVLAILLPIMQLNQALNL